ncbi:MAG: S49 family peptidase [Paracoccaceae bacterium]|nr:S49 family peptidase [Paracoccaceae bacterium]
MTFRIPFLSKSPSISILYLNGMIAAGGRGQLNDQILAPYIEKAFSKGKPAAVALVINSPGGSPVQSSLIAARIRRLADDKKIPVYAFVEDVAASGGYWLAVSADEIWADYGSIIGSIGVISAGFGAPAFLERQGFERRVYTAGKSKSTLDPFRAEKPEDVARLKTILDQLHEVFIDHVKARRGAKLVDDPNLFSGEFWTGQPAKDLGLIDGIGHIVPILKDRFGDKVKFRRYNVKRNILQRFGASIIQDAVSNVEERALYARFGM